MCVCVDHAEDLCTPSRRPMSFPLTWTYSLLCFCLCLACPCRAHVPLYYTTALIWTAGGQRPPPLVHYNSHYHALLFPITVNQLNLGGKGEVWTTKGYWETSSLDTYGDMAGCMDHCWRGWSYFSDGLYREYARSLRERCSSRICFQLIVLKWMCTKRVQRAHHEDHLSAKREDMLASLHLPPPSSASTHCPCGCPAVGGRVRGNCQFLGHPTPHACSFPCWHRCRRTHIHTNTHTIIVLTPFPMSEWVITMNESCLEFFWTHEAEKSCCQTSWLVTKALEPLLICSEHLSRHNSNVHLRTWRLKMIQ